METNLSKKTVPLASQNNSTLLPDFSFFNDSFRDIIRGNVFLSEDLGFVSGGIVNKDTLRACFMGTIPWATKPCQSINYVSCHDNHTLHDRIKISLPDATHGEIQLRCRLSAAFTFLSQGVPLFFAGEEFMRSKPLKSGLFDSNSYRSSDAVNALNWEVLSQKRYVDHITYYKGLIAFRKEHSSLRLTDRESIFSSIKPIACSNPHLLAFRVKDSSEKILVIFHAGTQETFFDLPDGNWTLYINADIAGTTPLGIYAGSVYVPPLSTMVFVQPKPKKIQDVVAALIWDDGRFLICQRPAYKARGLLWEFVGGKTEPGETKEHALVRECMEELNIRVDVESVFMDVVHLYPDIHIHLTLYHCHIADGTLEALEHNALKWITPAEIDEYSFCPADKDILKRIKEEYL